MDYGLLGLSGPGGVDVGLGGLGLSGLDGSIWNYPKLAHILQTQTVYKTIDLLHVG